jgi:hypothetical protein
MPTASTIRDFRPPQFTLGLQSDETPPTRKIENCPRALAFLKNILRLSSSLEGKTEVDELHVGAWVMPSGGRPGHIMQAEEAMQRQPTREFWLLPSNGVGNPGCGFPRGESYMNPRVAAAVKPTWRCQRDTTCRSYMYPTPGSTKAIPLGNLSGAPTLQGRRCDRLKVKARADDLFDDPASFPHVAGRSAPQGAI